jgi:EF hand domain-containing protein
MLTFRLVYRGLLPAASSSNGRNADKARIRRVFHPQLQELWKTHPALRMLYHHPQQQERYIKALDARFDFSRLSIPRGHANFACCSCAEMHLADWLRKVAISTTA